MSDLPPGHRAVPPAAADIPAVHDLIAAGHRAVLGFVDHTLADLRDQFAEPDFHPADDARLVLGPSPGGPVAGWAWACAKGGDAGVDIDVLARPGIPDHDAIADWLWDWALRRAAALAAATARPGGHAPATVDIGIYRVDHDQRARAAAHGATPATSFHRLGIRHRAPRPAPEPPAGVILARGPGGPALRRAAHAVHQEGMAAHFGFVPRDYASWSAMLESASTHDWGQLRVAHVGGEPAAMLLGSDIFAAEENYGYVRWVATRPAHRGRGLGRLLLLDHLAADAEAGRAGTYLHVDAGNTTPALGLYHSVGMREVLVIDVWRVTLDVAEPGVPEPGVAEPGVPAPEAPEPRR